MSLEHAASRKGELVEKDADSPIQLQLSGINPARRVQPPMPGPYPPQSGGQTPGSTDELWNLFPGIEIEQYTPGKGASVFRVLRIAAENENLFLDQRCKVLDYDPPGFQPGCKSPCKVTG